MGKIKPKIQLSRQRFPDNYFMSSLRKFSTPKDRYATPLLKIQTHYSDYRYIADEITSEIISRWKPNAPVIINAQTGAGKNFFILRRLMPKVLDENRGKKDVILIVSNRIALTRQTKLQFAEMLVSCTGNNKYRKEIERYYTNEGVDNCYIDFDVITVCSYHQLYERKILDRKNFKYIIFDECHFFTSDSTFNPNTHDILQESVEKGENAVRIYLSATPEIACESIISAEFNCIKNKVTQWAEELKKEAQSSATAIKFLSPNTKQVEGLNGNSYLLHNYQELASIIERESTFTYLTVEFHYFKRNYDYLNFVGTYDKNEDLIEKILHSESKWLIFVQSNSDGKKLENNLTSKDISCCFISRSEINATKSTAKNDFEELDENKKSNPAEEYNYLIENETFRPKVLIATSIIDNGINIKNDGFKKDSDKVLNIAIDTLDRTSFIQMIGRIRVTDGIPINLYIKNHSLENLKQAVSRHTEMLVKILSNDFQSLEGKKKNFDSKLFKYSENPDIFSTGNECAVTQLISLISTLLRIIRQNEPTYRVKLNDEMEAAKEKIYLAYKDDRNGSWDKPFSRSIVDLLESDIGAETREIYIEEDIQWGIIENKYLYTTDDTFTKYMFAEMIPSAIREEIQNYHDSCIRILNEQEKKIFDTLVERENKVRKYNLSVVEELQIIQKRFPKIYIEPFIEKIKFLEENALYYERLSDDSNISNLLEAQLQWIEKFDVPCSPVTNKIFEQETISENLTLEDFIASNAVTLDEIKANQRGKNERTLDAKFLENKGILKDDDLEKQVTEKFFDGQSISELLKNKETPPLLTIDKTTFEIKSFVTNTNTHKTYYLFVKN